MTVFCPNCGKPNTDQAAKCVSCGAELAAGGKAKFKGTMMMGSMGTPKPPTGPATPPPPSSATPPPPAPPAPSGPAPQDMAFQATMLGPMTAPGAPAAPPPGGSGQATPPSGAFGTPPSGAFGTPSSGAFGAQPPSGGYTPPAESASGAWSEASGSTAGFGQGPAPLGGPAAPGGYPNQGGFGAPPSHGGFTPPPGGTPPKSGKGKIILFVGIGCLVFSILACVIGWFACSYIAKKGGDSLEQTIATQGARASLSIMLGFMKANCANDPSGASNATYFHPKVAAQFQGQSCQVNDRVISVFGSEQSTAEVLADSDDESKAEDLGIEPSKCVRFTSGSAKIIGCTVEEGAGGSNFKLVHLENLQGA